MKGFVSNRPFSCDPYKLVSDLYNTTLCYPMSHCTALIPCDALKNTDDVFLSKADWSYHQQNSVLYYRLPGGNVVTVEEKHCLCTASLPLTNKLILLQECVYANREEAVGCWLQLDMGLFLFAAIAAQRAAAWREGSTDKTLKWVPCRGQIHR